MSIVLVPIVIIGDLLTYSQFNPASYDISSTRQSSRVWSVLLLGICGSASRFRFANDEHSNG
jgi:hypothetical protein